KMRTRPFNSPAGSPLPPVSLDSNVQVPWNFLTSFARSALSSARVPDPPGAAKPTAQNKATREIRIPDLLDMERTAILLPSEPAQRPGPQFGLWCCPEVPAAPARSGDLYGVREMSHRVARGGPTLGGPARLPPLAASCPTWVATLAGRP